MPPARPLPVFRFVGHSGSGKTILLEQLTRELGRRGLRVAFAKDTHHDVDLDRAGKDTWRMREAGAVEVALATERRLVLSQERAARASLADIAALVASRADILLAEGFRDSPEPAVVVWRSGLDRGWPHLRGPLLAVVSDTAPPVDCARFSFDDIEALADFLVQYRG